MVVIPITNKPKKGKGLIPMPEINESLTHELIYRFSYRIWDRRNSFVIIKTWIILATISALIQIFLAWRKMPHWIGMLLLAAFLAFAIYAWADLFWVGIWVGILLAFMIPPIFLDCLFEMVYWRTRWKERQIEYEK